MTTSNQYGTGSTPYIVPSNNRRRKRRIRRSSYRGYENSACSVCSTPPAENSICSVCSYSYTSSSTPNYVTYTQTVTGNCDNESNCCEEILDRIESYVNRLRRRCK